MSTTGTAASTEDLRVTRFAPLPTPADLRTELPLSAAQAELVSSTREQVEAIVAGRDPRLLLVVGPCSVHDPEAALEYARRLAPLAHEVRESVLVVMRVYFEKPRSTGGWKGLINDPYLNGTHRVADGLRIARLLLRDILSLGLPVGCEFLEPTSPQYIADAVSWGAIGARTTESQIHRQLASGLSMPVGFKNATDGDVQVAVDGCVSSAQPHVFFGIDEHGLAAAVETTGNAAGHVILRGGRQGPNSSSESVAAAAALLARAGLEPRMIVDASHANSGKDHVRQVAVVRELAAQLESGDPISGIMMESFLVGGAQKLDAQALGSLMFGQSATDACIDWATTEVLVRELAVAASARLPVPLPLPLTVPAS
ncbi:3-deoxy-7-phosphoheptulonate synthase [Subtercola boreus]|uniref:Phospho-2-dehydro-3-deoxyheptonate aldolase n=1 Tax=Subtercola boreus TaxID=120213 RepID=A0A3E0WH72_9MICO|nr:3-deoxy-7-phosphoheptulonate synthase [Subtercola boreus]RFA23492.1 3-deoxy-7-phosphoheptulonate synthase [Subtercola boreus]RFA23885.1 3-deoxy-7-phosphoheptulonate synthase [Subtercola boreus]RFA29585.1 3-deoxy-7-phosphoheptulonate synthase [Subtercola boreus]